MKEIGISCLSRRYCNNMLTRSSMRWSGGDIFLSWTSRLTVIRPLTLRALFREAFCVQLNACSTFLSQLIILGVFPFNSIWVRNADLNTNRFASEKIVKNVPLLSSVRSQFLEFAFAAFYDSYCNTAVIHTIFRSTYAVSVHLQFKRSIRKIRLAKKWTELTKA